MNNQGWPDERCAACGLKAKLNMGCGSGEPLYIRLRPCSRCKEVRYCNRECQLKHWKAGHKNVCVKAGDKPPPPMAEELRTAVAAQIAKRGCYILAHAPGHSGDAPLGPDDALVPDAVPARLKRAPPRSLLNADREDRDPRPPRPRSPGSVPAVVSSRPHCVRHRVETPPRPLPLDDDLIV